MLYITFLEVTTNQGSINDDYKVEYVGLSQNGDISGFPVICIDGLKFRANSKILFVVNFEQNIYLEFCSHAEIIEPNNHEINSVN